MSSRKQSRYGAKKRKANNILLFKLIDPVAQSLFFVAFLYTLDGMIDSDFIRLTYQFCFKALIVLQIISIVINQFLKDSNEYKTQRLFFLLAFIIYLVCYFFLTANMKETYMESIGGAGMVRLPMKEIALMSAGGIIAFLYFVLCFNEVRSQLKREDEEEY